MISRMIGLRRRITNAAKYICASKSRMTSEQFLAGLERVERKEESQEAYIVPKEKLDSLFNEYHILYDKDRRSSAETENVRRRGQKQVEDAQVFDAQCFCKDLLEAADTLELAVGAVKPESIQKSEEVKSLHAGVVMMKTVLLKTFEKHGLVAITPNGEKFDPNLHEAVFQILKDRKAPPYNKQAFVSFLCNLSPGIGGGGEQMKYSFNHITHVKPSFFYSPTTPDVCQTFKIKKYEALSNYVSVVYKNL